MFPVLLGQGASLHNYQTPLGWPALEMLFDPTGHVQGLTPWLNKELNTEEFSQDGLFLLMLLHHLFKNFCLLFIRRWRELIISWKQGRKTKKSNNNNMNSTSNPEHIFRLLCFYLLGQIFVLLFFLWNDLVWTENLWSGIFV